MTEDHHYAVGFTYRSVAAPPYGERTAYYGQYRMTDARAWTTVRNENSLTVSYASRVAAEKAAWTRGLEALVENFESQ